MATSKLPSSLESEKVVLGSIILDGSLYPSVAQSLTPEDFSIEDHRQIFRAMDELQARGDEIDRLTIHAELQRQSSRVSISDLLDLDQNAPAKVNVASYAGIVAEKSRLRRLIRHGQRLMTEAMAADAVSTDVIATGQAGLLDIGNTLDERGQMVSEFVAAFPGGLYRMLQPWESDRGIPTGFGKLDEWTGGLHRKEIFTIGARPGQGKTAIGLNIIHNITRKKRLCAFFSLEMSKRACLNRLICAEARVDVNMFRKGDINAQQKEDLQAAARRVAMLPLFIDDRSGLRVSDISMALQALTREAPVAACLIDYFQLLRPKKAVKYSNDNELFTVIAHDLQQLAKTTGIPLIILSQLNRESEKANGDKRPKLSQCRGAGAIEEISNVGGVIYREAMYRRDRDDLRGTALLIIDKNREGPSGDIKLLYQESLTLFENRSEDIPDDEPEVATNPEPGPGSTGRVGGEAEAGDAAEPGAPGIEAPTGELIGLPWDSDEAPSFDFEEEPA